MARILNRKTKILVLLMLLPVLVMGIWLADFLLGRPDRIHVGLETNRMLKLRDSIILFAKDRKKFPEKLTELIPGYCSDQELSYQRNRQSNSSSTYQWNPVTGELSCSDPFPVRGLYSREMRIPVIIIEKLTVKLNPLNGENVFSQPANKIPIGPDSVMIEAENMQFMTYGWQIGEAEDASGGAYLHIKEGIGDFESEDKIEADPVKARSGDFYNITHDQRRIQAGLYFLVPAAGTYNVYVRTMAQRSNCSNMTYIKINEYPKVDVGHNGSQPFAWRWHRIGRFQLKQGVNQLSFMTYQDGVRVDQVLLAPKYQPDLNPNRTFTGGFIGDIDKLQEIPPLNLSLTVNTLNITREKDPQVFIYVHKNIAGPVEASLDIQLDLPGGRVRVDSHNIKLEKKLTRFPCRIDLPRPLDRKEYLLQSSLFIGEKKIAERTLVLFHGYDWQILGPLPYMAAGEEGPVEKDDLPKAEYQFQGKTFTWQKYDEKNTEQFGLLDFGLMFSGRTYNAMSDVCLYAYTEIDVVEKGLYLLKVQSDDNIVVWVNGKRVAEITEKGPPIRTAKEEKVPLDKGINRLLFRLNQHESQWQASIRLRTEDDKLAAVRGRETEIRKPKAEAGSK